MMLSWVTQIKDVLTGHRPPAFTCPRRGEGTLGGLAFSGVTITEYARFCQACLEHPDHAQDRWYSYCGEWHCSYCGSIHPEVFMRLIRDDAEIGPTDKSYKVYVDGAATKFYLCHLSPENGHEFRSLQAQGKLNIGYPARFYAGLYLPPEPEP